MALNAGTRLGPYEIADQLGAGGMGEVYRATDTRLDRTVAIKVLPEHLASDPQRRERFEREAKAVSSLNHPHICTLYDVGEQDGVHYLVMELVEGETLGQRLEKGRLPLDQALEYAIQIADALDKAHRQGVVHRDLKPGNIMITKSAGVKLLDFGLAKLKGDAGEVSPLSQMPTQDPSAPLTAEGTIIGTLQYMAPEQLEGKEADARTDIFAFGAVVYEMVTGKKAFEGASQASLIGAIMNQQPAPVTEVQPVSPPMLDHVITACLAKNPEDRWQTGTDLGRELKWIDEVGAQNGTVAVETGHGGRERVAWVAATAVLLIALLILVTTRVEPPAGAPEAVRFALTLPPETAPTSTRISPDGSRLAYSAPQPDGTNVVWVRALDSVEAQPLAGTEGAGGPFWSPNSDRLGINVLGQLQSIDLAGGSPQTVHDGIVSHGIWNDDGVIVFRDQTQRQMYRARSVGGEVMLLDVGDGRGFPMDFLPDEDHFLYRAGPSVYIGSLESGESSFLFDSPSPVLYSDGYLLFVRGGALMAQRFDPIQLKVDGDPQVIDQQVVSPDVTRRYDTAFSVSQDGTLAFRPGTGVDGQLVWFDRTGGELGRIQQPRSGEYVNPSVSPDGRRIAVNRKDPSSGNVDIWLIDAERGSTERFTTAASFDADGVWSPDSSKIAFTSSRSGQRGIWVKDVAGGDAELLTDVGVLRITHWSKDGQFILYDHTSSDRDGDVWVLPVSRDEEPWPLLDSEFIEYGARFSPDGSWVAYNSTETGNYEVHVASFPGGRDRQRISTDGGGLHPRWQGDGRRLFYYNRTGSFVMSVAMEVDSSGLQIGASEVAIERKIMGLTDSRNHYAVTPDGERLLLRRPSLDPPPTTIVTNWTSLLEDNQ